MAKPASPEAPPHPWLAGVPPRPHPAHRVAPSTARHAVLPSPTPCFSLRFPWWVGVEQAAWEGWEGEAPTPQPLFCAAGEGKVARLE